MQPANTISWYNRWKELYYLGLDLDSLTEWGISPEDCEPVIDAVAHQHSRAVWQRGWSGHLLEWYLLKTV
jgi:hypothetical protein